MSILVPATRPPTASKDVQVRTLKGSSSCHASVRSALSSFGGPWIKANCQLNGAPATAFLGNGQQSHISHHHMPFIRCAPQ